MKLQSLFLLCAGIASTTALKRPIKLALTPESENSDSVLLYRESFFNFKEPAFAQSRGGVRTGDPYGPRGARRRVSRADRRGEGVLDLGRGLRNASVRRDRKRIHASLDLVFRYALEMIGVTEPDASKKYWNTPSTPAMKNALQWLSLVITFMSGMVVFGLKNGMDAVKLCQAGAVVWSCCFALECDQISKGANKTEGPYIQGAMAALLAYLGYA